MSLAAIELPDEARRWRSAPVRHVPANGGAPPRSREAYAAVHVVADPIREPNGGGRAHWDRDATRAFREYIWDQGLGVAEAMDTAQRGAGLDWSACKDLIADTLEAAHRRDGAAVVVGAGTDQLEPAGNNTLSAIIDAYLEQIDFIESKGGRAVIMASRALARTARTPADFELVYRKTIDGSRLPVLLHWLDDMFDPQLRGYWGSVDLAEAAITVRRIMDEAGPSRVRGIKISLLDADFEMRFRAQLSHGQVVYTGDDFNFPSLIYGEGRNFSHALLGVFDPLAPLAAAALRRLDAADDAGFRDILEPTVPFARHLFAAPTYFYKVGIVFLAWLNGHQDHFCMVGGMQGQRSLQHLLRLVELAAGCGALRDATLAQDRLNTFLRVAGVAK